MTFLITFNFTQDEAYREIVNVVGEHNENPTYREINELKYLERFVKEVLRLYPSAPTILRVAGEDIKTSNGYTIPKGAAVGLLIYDLHRNPKVWEDPEKFDPERFLPENTVERHPYAYIPFSAGQRNCIGLCLDFPKFGHHHHHQPILVHCRT